MSKRVPRPFHLAIVGATGIVGQELFSILHARGFPVASIKALASEKSAGEKITFGEDEIVVEALTPKSFEGVEVAFFAVSGSLAAEYCPIAAKAGAVCIDKSSAHRAFSDVPLVVPEVNPKDIAKFKARRIIASPNCTAVPLTQVLKPLHQKAGLKRVVVSSYQAVSGAGREGMEELDKQVRDLFNMRDVESKVFGNRIAFNVLPCIPAVNAFEESGYTEEESKVMAETRRVLDLPELAVTATCARVPVFNGHSAAVHMEFARAISEDEAREALVNAPGLMVIDDRQKSLYPTAVDASGEDMTLVGRIRRDAAMPNGIALWFASDNLRTGAALNAVRIAEILCAEYLA